MSICTGAFVLGHAGLLDGRTATTHWSVAPLLASMFPAARVDPRALFVDDGSVLTSAGLSAGMDLALHVVRGDFGVDVAAALARRLVLAGYRPGGQAQYVDFPLMPQPGDPLPRLLEWMGEHLDQPQSLARLARQVHMSPRTLTRRFSALTGTTPHRWLTRERLLAAQRMLEHGDEPVERIAHRAGFSSAATMRHRFVQEVGMAPQQYRAVFRSRQRPVVPAGGLTRAERPAARAAPYGVASV